MQNCQSSLWSLKFWVESGRNQTGSAILISRNFICSHWLIPNKLNQAFLTNVILSVLLQGLKKLQWQHFEEILYENLSFLPEKKKIIEGFHRMHYIKESRTKKNILKTTCTWCSLLKDDSKTILSKVVFQIFWLYVVSALKIKKERQITGDVSFPEKKTSRDTTRFFIGQICVFHQILQAEMTCHDSINYKMQNKKTYRMDSWPWWACLPPAAPTRPRRWWPSLWEYVADY